MPERLRQRESYSGFRGTDKVMDAEVPAKRELDDDTREKIEEKSNGTDWMNIPDGVEDDGLPF